MSPIYPPALLFAVRRHRAGLGRSAGLFRRAEGSSRRRSLPGCPRQGGCKGDLFCWQTLEHTAEETLGPEACSSCPQLTAHPARACLPQDGSSALMQAARGGHVECVRALLQAGADVALADQVCWSYCATTAHTAVVARRRAWACHCRASGLACHAPPIRPGGTKEAVGKLRRCTHPLAPTAVLLAARPHRADVGRHERRA